MIRFSLLFLAWQFNIKCISRVEVLNQSGLFMLISTTYELTGADIASGPVWIEYVTFLKSLPVCIMLAVFCSFFGFG